MGCIERRQVRKRRLHLRKEAPERNRQTHTFPLTKRLEIAEVVDPEGRDTDQIYFGATVTVLNGRNETFTVSIVGVDEIDTARRRVSWISPIARALTKARAGDVVILDTPGGREDLELLEVRYLPLD